MSQLPPTTTYQRSPLAEALACYEAALDEGETPDRQAFLARHPDLASELAGLLDEAEKVAARTRALREGLGGRSPSPVSAPEGFEIIEEIGRGGMGVVYKARQKGTEQLVALKMPRPDWGGPDAVRQLREEARVAAQLRHPNRVRILLLGEHQGLPFYVMELIEGSNLAQVAKEGVSKAAAVQYLIGIAEAVHEAHQHGIVHRDIKPHNILVDARSNAALLIDFGQAVAGTLPYMSAEATRGADQVTAASDIYSLGATLYELLTGEPPFLPRPGETRQDFSERIRNEAPVPPRQRRPGVNREINAICMKCLRKDSAERYASAQDLAQALRRYLQDIEYSRHFTSMGTLFLGLGPLVALLNVVVFLLIQAYARQSSGWVEAAVWAGIFSMYPALFSVFALAPPTEIGREHYLSRLELWSLWGGKMFAAIFICAALRLEFAKEPEEPVRAMRLCYVVFAALSGMAVFAMISKMSWKLAAGFAAGCWLVGGIMVCFLEFAPLLYGGYCFFGLSLFGLYLRGIGRELS